MTLFLKKHILFLIIFISALAIFSAWNKYWGPYDEGIITVAAERALHGEVPYRDFFLIMYPPGQVYVLAFLYKIFGVSLAIGRIYTGFIQILIAALVFLMSKTLAKKSVISLGAWLMALSCLGPRMGLIPAPIWPGVAFSLFSVYLFMLYTEKGEGRYLILAGILTGVSIIFRHDIGLYCFISIFLSLFFIKDFAKNIFIYTLSAALVPSPFFIYLIYKGAFKDMAESLFLFPFIHEKTAGLFFPAPCFNFTMIWHQSLYFINANQYYIPLLIYAVTGIMLLGRFAKERALDKKDLTLFCLLVFGSLVFNQVRVRTDPAHLLTVIFPSILLFSGLAHKTLEPEGMAQFARYVYSVFIALVFFLFLLLFIKNTDKYIKNVFRKPLKGEALLTRFERGAVYVPKEDIDIKDAVNFIKENTEENERIYVGNIAHRKDDFGGSIVFYTLCGRLPSAKYYEIAPGLITQGKVQEEIAGSLSRHNVRYIVLQDIDIGSGAVTDSSVTRLDSYIKGHFKKVRKFGKYNIYKKI